MLVSNFSSTMGSMVVRNRQKYVLPLLPGKIWIRVVCSFSFSLPMFKLPCYTGRSQCHNLPLLENAVFFGFLVVASVTFHCGIVGSGLRNLAKTCSQRLLGPILHNVIQNDFRV